MLGCWRAFTLISPIGALTLNPGDFTSISCQLWFCPPNCRYSVSLSTSGAVAHLSAEREARMHDFFRAYLLASEPTLPQSLPYCMIMRLKANTRHATRDTRHATSTVYKVRTRPQPSPGVLCHIWMPLYRHHTHYTHLSQHQPQILCSLSTNARQMKENDEHSMV